MPRGQIIVRRYFIAYNSQGGCSQLGKAFGTCAYTLLRLLYVHCLGATRKSLREGGKTESMSDIGVLSNKGRMLMMDVSLCFNGGEGDTARAPRVLCISVRAKNDMLECVMRISEPLLDHVCSILTPPRQKWNSPSSAWSLDFYGKQTLPDRNDKGQIRALRRKLAFSFGLFWMHGLEWVIYLHTHT